MTTKVIDLNKSSEEESSIKPKVIVELENSVEEINNSIERIDQDIEFIDYKIENKYMEIDARLNELHKYIGEIEKDTINNFQAILVIAITELITWVLFAILLVYTTNFTS